jgi:hypothetical protein
MYRLFHFYFFEKHLVLHAGHQPTFSDRLLESSEKSNPIAIGCEKDFSRPLKKSVTVDDIDVDKEFRQINFNHQY